MIFDISSRGAELFDATLSNEALHQRGKGGLINVNHLYLLHVHGDETVLRLPSFLSLESCCFDLQFHNGTPFDSYPNNFDTCPAHVRPLFDTFPTLFRPLFLIQLELHFGELRQFGLHYTSPVMFPHVTEQGRPSCHGSKAVQPAHGAVVRHAGNSLSRISSHSGNERLKATFMT